jgi:tetratricopeptide (TPR) repeat protein
MPQASFATITLVWSLITAVPSASAIGREQSPDGQQQATEPAPQPVVNPTADVWLKIISLETEAESYEHNGWLFLGHKKREEAEHFATRHFGDDHWITHEAKLRRKLVQTFCEWPDDRQQQVLVLFRHIKAANSSLKSGDYFAALNDAEMARDLCEKLELAESPLYSDILAVLASCNSWTSNAESSAAYYSKRLKTLQSLYGDEHRGVVFAESNLGAELRNTASFFESEPLLRSGYRRALQYSAACSHDPYALHAYVAASRNLGAFYVRTREYDKADELFTKCLEAIEAHQADEHSRKLAIVIRLEISQLLVDQGKKEKALAASKQLKAQAGNGDVGNPFSEAALRFGLAVNFLRLREAAEARLQIEKATTMLEQFEPLPTHLRQSIGLANARLAFVEGRYTVAHTALTEYLETEERRCGQLHPALLPVLELCAESSERLGNDDQARLLRERMRVIEQRIEQYKKTRTD